MLSRGGPYPSPRALIKRALLLLDDWIETDDDDGATKADALPATDAAPRSARLSVGNFMLDWICCSKDIMMWLVR